ncbi:hypothetical protein FACS1894130_05040 [Spirochaetia bacterium]|nr:hypothetical protein FACS1894130_05040 [Spirochaetia bacterium]
MLKDDATALKVCYRVNGANGEYELKEETLYNASQIEEAPAYTPTGNRYEGFTPHIRNYG